MFISWRRPARDHSACCLPCAVCNTCLVLFSVPPTFCFGLLFAAAQSARSRVESAISESSQEVTEVVRLPSSRASSKPWSFESERRLWLLTLAKLFQSCSELRDFGTIIWAFLLDHPDTLRVALKSGVVRDFSLRKQASVSQVLHAVAPWKILGFLPGAAGAVFASSANHSVALCSLTNAEEQLCKDAAASAAANRLAGHSGLVTCFAVGVDGLIATGSEDAMVRVWQDDQCIRTCASYEWSEWTGTMYLGHVHMVTAVCLDHEDRLASGDECGNVAFWRSDNGCQMLHPPLPGPVGLLASGQVHGQMLLLIGCLDGSIRVVAWDTMAVWYSCNFSRMKCGGVALAVMFSVSGLDEVFIACTRGLLRARLASKEIEEIVPFPWCATTASFNHNGAWLLVSNGTSLALLSTQDGCIRAELQTTQCSSPGDDDSNNSKGDLVQHVALLQRASQ